MNKEFNMKSVILAAFLAVSTAVSAQPVEISRSDDGEVWVGYFETFSRNRDGFTMMVGQRIPGRNENRSFVGVEVTTCQRGFGALFFRMSPNDQWQELMNITTLSTQTVGDEIAQRLCSIGGVRVDQRNRT